MAPGLISPPPKENPDQTKVNYECKQQQDETMRKVTVANCPSQQLQTGPNFMYILDAEQIRVFIKF